MAKVITYPGRSWPELFDLTNDPYDLANLAQSPARQALRARMRDGLDRVKHAVNFKIPTAADEVPPEAIDSWINKEPNQ